MLRQHRPPPFPYDPQNPEAAEGTAAHEALAAIVVGLLPDLEAIATAHNVEVDALDKIVWRATEQWEEIQQWFPSPISEVAMEMELAEGVVLRGHSDVVGVTPGSDVPERLSVNDWKFGHTRDEHPAQLKSYGLLARHTYGMPKSGYILSIETFVREGERRQLKLTSEDLDRFQEQLLHQVRRMGKQFGPRADVCKYCPHQNNCVALEHYQQSSGNAIIPLGGNRYPVSREMIGELWDRSRVLTKALERFNTLAKQFAEQGPIKLPDGRVLKFKEEEHTTIDASGALPLLQAMDLNGEEMDIACSVTKTGIEKVIKKRSPHGDGANNVRRFMAKLRSVGAVEYVPKKKLRAIKE